MRVNWHSSAHNWHLTSAIVPVLPHELACLLHQQIYVSGSRTTLQRAHQREKGCTIPQTASRALWDYSIYVHEACSSKLSYLAEICYVYLSPVWLPLFHILSWFQNKILHPNGSYYYDNSQYFSCVWNFSGFNICKILGGELLYLEITTLFVTRQTNVGYIICCACSMFWCKTCSYCTSVGTTFCGHCLKPFLWRAKHNLSMQDTLWQTDSHTSSIIKLY